MTCVPAARPPRPPLLAAGRPPAAAAGTMLTGTTPSTHDGRLNDLAPGVDGGEFTGEMVMSSGAEPLSCDDAASPSSRDLPDVPPPSRLPVFLLPPRLRLRCRCSQLPRDDLELSLPPAAKSGSLVHLSYGHAMQPLVISTVREYYTHRLSLRDSPRAVTPSCVNCILH